MPTLPLEGVRVIDFTVVWAGGYTTMLLADLGAEVIRVENPWIFPSSTRGYVPRPTREMAKSMSMVGAGYPDYDPGERPWNRHMLFTCHGRNKRSMTVDIRKPSGRNILLELVDRSDLLVENNPAGFLEKFDIGWDVLKARNPRLSVLRMPPLGLSGPHLKYVGFGQNFEALCGLISLRGYHDSEPTERTPTPYMDAVSGASGAFASLLAVRRQRRTGNGSMIELAQAENLLQTIGEYLIDAASGGPPARPMGNRHPRYAPQGAYPCVGDDKWVVISVRCDAEWKTLVQLMGSPAWAMDPSLDTESGRRDAHDPIDELISEWTASRDRHDIFHECQAAGVPAAPVLTAAEAFEDAQLIARDYFRPLTSPDTGTHLYPAHSFTWTGPPFPWGRPAPGLGVDNEYVYREILGFDDDAYKAAEAEGHISLDYLDRDGNPL